MAIGSDKPFYLLHVLDLCFIVFVVNISHHQEEVLKEGEAVVEVYSLHCS